MSKRQTLPTRPTAAQVREALGIPSSRRGVLSRQEVADYNRGKRSEKRYVPGNSRTAAAEAKAQRAALVEAGVAGKRGPLGKAAKEYLAQPKG